MTDLKLYQERDMGAKAERLSNDPAFIEATSRFRAKMMSGWENSKSNEVEEREEFFRLVKLLDGLGAQLNIIIDEGTVAAAEIKAEEANG